MVASNVHALDTVHKDVECYKNNQTIKNLSTVADNYRELKEVDKQSNIQTIELYRELQSVTAKNIHSKDDDKFALERCGIGKERFQIFDQCTKVPSKYLLQRLPKDPYKMSR